MTTIPTGFFIDWNGRTRSTTDAGGGFVVEVDVGARYVALSTPAGSLMHEATYYRSLDDIVRKGLKVDLVPGSEPWGGKDEW